MNHAFDQLKLARICLQLRTPLALGSGLYDAMAQLPYVLDANGLPVIPATSLAGALRSLLNDCSRLNDGSQRPAGSRLFGAAVDVAAPENGASALSISFAHIHDANNGVIDGRVAREQLESDPILSPLVGSVKPIKEQVRLNEYGTVDEMGKFERSIVPAGHRFSFELQLWHDQEGAEQAQTDWQNLQRALQAPGFALGGGSRSGLGRIVLVQWCEASFDLRNPQQAQRFAALPVRLDQAASVLTPTPLPAKAAGPQQGWEVWQLDLQFSDYWRIGSGQDAVCAPAAGAETAAQLLPLTQQVVQWTNQRGQLARQLILPGSGIKGALRHRTEYYLRCLQLGNGLSPEQNSQTLEQDIASLFGRIGSNDAKLPGSAGRVWLDDVFLPLPRQTQTLMHNRIDHFTQGTRDGALFGEEMLYQQTWCCQLALQAGSTPNAYQALQLALADLCQQRLPLGSASARGHGYVQGSSSAVSTVLAAALFTTAATPCTTAVTQGEHHA